MKDVMGCLEETAGIIICLVVDEPHPTTALGAVSELGGTSVATETSIVKGQHGICAYCRGPVQDFDPKCQCGCALVRVWNCDWENPKLSGD